MLRRSYKRKGTAVPTHAMKEHLIRNLDTTEVCGQKSGSGRKRIFIRFLKYALRSGAGVHIATIETLSRSLNEYRWIILYYIPLILYILFHYII